MEPITRLKKPLFEELSKFEQNMLLKDNIDYDKIDDPILAIQLIKSYEVYALLDYIIDIQLVLFKNDIKNYITINISDEEAYKFANKTSVPKKYSSMPMNISIKTLSNYDIKRLDNDTSIINALQARGLKLSTKDLKEAFPKFRSLMYFYCFRSCVENIKLRNELNQLGLAEYTKKVTLRYLSKEEYEILCSRPIDINKEQKFTIDLQRKKRNIRKHVPKKK